MEQKRLGIIGAMDSEVRLLKEKLGERQSLHCAGIEFCFGLLEGCPVVVAKCGEGKVSAAICAQAMIDHFELWGIVNTGVAGGLHPSLEVGDIVVSTDAVQHDFDITALGYVKGAMPGHDKSLPTRYLADRELLESFGRAASQALKAHNGGKNKWIKGTIASGDIFVDDSRLKRELISRFDASAAEMEGAAIAQTAQANRVPFLIIRAISDLAEKQANVSFETFEKQAAELSCHIVLEMCRSAGGKEAE